VTCISEIEHAPKLSVGVGFGYLKQGKIGRIRGRKGQFIDGGYDASICDGPFEVSGSFAFYDASVVRAPMTRVGGRRI